MDMLRCTLFQSDDPSPSPSPSIASGRCNSRNCTYDDALEGVGKMKVGWSEPSWRMVQGGFRS